MSFSALRTTIALTALMLIGVSAAAQTTAPAPPATDFKRLSLDELLQIEVTSVSRRPEQLFESASAIQVITAEDIRRSGATNLPEALRLASNLHVAQIDARQWAISARGFNSTSSNKLLVLIDGRAVYTPLYAGVFWDVQDVLLEDIDRIEIISGPGATLWGSNAVNGVINITTKSAKDTQGLLAEGSVGSELRAGGAVRYGASLGEQAHLRGYGKYSDRDQSTLPSGADAPDDWHLGQSGFRLDWQRSPADVVTVQGDLYSGRGTQAAPGTIELGGGNLTGRWTHTFSENTDVSVQVYYDRTHRLVPGSFAEDLDTYNADVQYSTRLAAKHQIVSGFGYRASKDDVTSSATLAFLPAKITRHLFNGFVQDEILLNPQLHITVGTKVEHNDYTGVEVQPSGRLSWLPRERQTLWGAVSRAVRSPSRIDREFYSPARAPYLLAGGPDFKSEGLVAYELGYRAQVYEQLAISIATFYNVYDDIRSLEPLNPPAPVPLVIANGQEGTSYGAELTADLRITDWWQLLVGYNGLHLRLTPKSGSNDRTFGSTESHDPVHQGFIRQSLDLPGRVQLDLRFRAVGEIANQSVPAFGELGGRLAWQATPQLELALVGQNLLQDHHPEFGAATSRREIERSISGKLTWRF
jgi:iron complex outermembrane receptor protein